MAKESSFKNMVISLGIICLICSALLSVVYVVTKEPIELATAAKTNDAIAKVLPQFDNVPGETKDAVEFSGKEFTYYTAKNGDDVVGYAIESSATGFGGDIKLMVGFETATGTIYNVCVISHSETPGLGAKIGDDSEGNFKEQFRGFNPASQKLLVSKDGGDVDAITASTVTSRAFTVAVESAYEVYKTLKGDSDVVSSASQNVKTDEGGQK